MLRKNFRLGILVTVLVFIVTLGNIYAQQVPQVPHLRGQKFTVGSSWESYDVSTYKPEDITAQRGLEYRKKLLSDNGFNMSVVKLTEDYDAYFQLVTINILSGSKNNHVYEVSADMAVALMKQGLLYPVSDSRAVDLKNRTEAAYEKPSYNGLVESFMTSNGKQYGWQYGRPNDSWLQAMLFFNADHIRNAGYNMEHIYDLQKENNWTWTTFYELCKKLKRGNTYAIHADDAREFLRALIFSNGGNLVTFDKKGKAQNTVNNAAVIEAMNFYNQLINEGLVLTTPVWNWGEDWEAFKQQKVSMVFQPEWRKNEVMNFPFTHGIALPPRGPKQRNYRMDAMDNVFVIPKTFSPAEVDNILKAMELWKAPTDTDWQASHYSRAKNPRDVTETVAMSRDLQFLTPANHKLIPGFPLDDFIQEFRNGLGKIKPADHIKTWTPKINDAVNAYNK